MQKVVQVCGGYSHTLILVESGMIYHAGNNYFGKTNPKDHGCTCEPSPIDPKYFNHQKIISIRSGNQHCLALTKNGNVFSWGLGLGLGNQKHHRIPQKINPSHFNHEPIRYIACGANNFSYAITENNNVYSWGSNNEGQLGLGNNVDSFNPKLVLVDEFAQGQKIKTICCGYNHTLCMTQDNKIYACGANTFGALGIESIEKEKKSINTFQNVMIDHDPNDNVKYIRTGCFSMALFESGMLYTWGNNLYGQLGLGCLENQNTPQCVKSFHFENKKIIKIDCGNYNSFAITQNQNVYAWGINYFKGVKTPTRTSNFENKKIIRIIGCWGISKKSHCFAITSCGKLFAWGSNDQGQLALNHYEDVQKPERCCSHLFG